MVVFLERNQKKNIFEAVHIQHELWSEDEEVNDSSANNMSLEKAKEDQVVDEEDKTPLPNDNGDEDVFANMTPV